MDSSTTRVPTVRRETIICDLHGRVLCRKNGEATKITKLSDKFPAHGRGYLFYTCSTEILQKFSAREIPSCKRKKIPERLKRGEGSVAVWGCMPTSGVGNFLFVESAMNKDVLRENFGGHHRETGIAKQYTFRQDNGRNFKVIVNDNVALAPEWRKLITVQL